MTHLPDELWVAIFSFCDPHTAVCLRWCSQVPFCVSRSDGWRAIANVATNDAIAVRHCIALVRPMSDANKDRLLNSPGALHCFSLPQELFAFGSECLTQKSRDLFKIVVANRLTERLPVSMAAPLLGLALVTVALKASENDLALWLLRRLASDVSSAQLLRLFESACQSDKTLPVAQWILHGHHLRVHHLPCFLYACMRGQIAIVRFLLEEAQCDPTENHNEALQLASEQGHLEVVRLLLSDPRVDAADDGQAAYRVAVENDHTAVAELLKAHGGTIQRRRNQ